MKMTIRYINYLGFVLALCTTVVFGCRFSTSKHTPNPLAGWHAASNDPNQSIINDYRDYIQKLSAEEKENLGPSPVSYFENGTDQYAVRIEIGINGKEWEHILIYDKNGKRIKTIKYVSGHYQS